LSVNEADFETVWHTLFGNGKEGLTDHVAEMRRDLYKDEKRNSPGLVADVQEIKNMIRGATGWVKGAAAALMLGGLTGAAAAMKSLLGL
jgi:hypothetical protein